MDPARPERPPEGDPRPWVERAPLALSRGTVDFARSRFLRHDHTIEALSPREAAVLAYLSDRPNRTVPRDELLARVWGHSDQSLSRAVDTTISRLRRKLEPDPAIPQMLFTEHGAGYRLLVDAGPEAAPPPPPAPVRRLLQLGGRVADLTAGHVEGADGRTPLTAQERLLIEELLRVEGAALPGARIARRLGMPSEGALRNAVFRLRTKIEPDPGHPCHLLSVPGGAYRLEARVRPPETARGLHLQALISLTDHVGGVLGFPDCVVYIAEPDGLRQVAAFGPKRAVDGQLRSPLLQAPGQGIVGAAAELRAPVLCADTGNDARYLADLLPARSELSVPVLASGRVVGVLDAEHPDPGAFGPTHVNTFVSLAAIAAPAFARLHGGSDV